MSEPDFEALRAARNAKRREFYESMANDGWLPSTPKCVLQDDNACYCDCAAGDPCEHKWDGDWYESEDGSISSATCSRCGLTAIIHDLRNAP